VVRSTIAAGDDIDTVDDETGQYLLGLPTGSYNLVAYFTEYEPVCRTVSLIAETATTQNFSLNSVETGTIAGAVNITEPDEDQHVTIDFRQAGHCDNPATIINVKTLKVADGGVYSAELPVGIYEVVVSTSDFVTQVTDVEVFQDATTSHNIVF
jgi:hypothetical protein